MVKFKVLELVQTVLTRLGMYPQSLTGTYDFKKAIPLYYITFLILGMFITSSSLFVYQNIGEFELALGTTLIVIAGFQIGGMLLSIRLRVEKVEELHRTLQDIVDKSNFHAILRCA